MEGLIDRSKGDTIVDYRKGDESVVAEIKSALKGTSLGHAFDAVSEKGSFINICKVLEPKGRITLVLPGSDYSAIPKTFHSSETRVGDVHKNHKDFGFVHFQNIARGLAEGWFKPHPHESVAGGLGGVEKALNNLKNGKASALKYVFRIEDTAGLPKL